MSEQTVDVPAIGRVDKRWVYAGVALTVGIVGYAWWASRGSSSETTTPTDPGVADDMGTIDDGWGNVPGSTGNSGGDFGSPDDILDTNAEWTTYAVETLADYGFEPQFTAEALGKWLARQPLTTSEKALVLTARGLFGEPPVGGPYPVLDSLPDTNPPPGGDDDDTPPAAPGKPGVPVIGTVWSPDKGRIKVNWVAGKNTSRVRIVDNGGPSFNPNGTTLGEGGTAGPRYLAGLTSGRTYYVGVRGYNSAGAVSSQSKIVAVKVK